MEKEISLIYLKSKKSGFGIVEVIVAAAIISLALAGMAVLGNFALRIQSHLKQNLIATNLAIEAIEATRAVKEESWANFSVLGLDIPYHPEKIGPPAKWVMVGGAQNINGFSRQIVFSQVLRDMDDDIVESGGIPDSNTRKITVIISWFERGQSYQVVLNSYSTNWKR